LRIIKKMRIPIRAIAARPPTTPPTMAPIGGLEAVEGVPVGVLGMVELDVVLVAVVGAVELGAASELEVGDESDVGV
jgi:hypothetical protein